MIGAVLASYLVNFIVETVNMSEQPQQPSSVKRNEMRAKVFAQKPKVSTVTLEDGLVVEVRQSTVGAMLDAVDVDSSKERMARMMIMTCYVPETGEPLFELGDVEDLMAMPSGGYYQKLIDAINQFSPDRGLDQAKKTSGEVQP